MVRYMMLTTYVTHAIGQQMTSSLFNDSIPIVRSCSGNFPVKSYTVLVKNKLNELVEEIRLNLDADFLLSPPLDEKVFVTLNQTNVPSLREPGMLS